MPDTRPLSARADNWAAQPATQHKSYTPWAQYRALDTKDNTMPQLVTLAPRKGTVQFTTEQLDEIVAVLAQAGRRQAVTVDDIPLDTESKARARARIVQQDLAARTPPVHVKAVTAEGTDGKHYGAVIIKNVKPTPVPASPDVAAAPAQRSK